MQVLLAKFRTEKCAVKQIICETKAEYRASLQEMLLMQELQFDKVRLLEPPCKCTRRRRLRMSGGVVAVWERVHEMGRVPLVALRPRVTSFRRCCVAAFAPTLRLLQKFQFSWHRRSGARMLMGTCAVPTSKHPSLALLA